MSSACSPFFSFVDKLSDSIELFARCGFSFQNVLYQVQRRAAKSFLHQRTDQFVTGCPLRLPWAIYMRLLPFITHDETLLLHYLHELEHGRVCGRPALVDLLENLADRRFLQIPENIEYLELSGRRLTCWLHDDYLRTLS